MKISGLEKMIMDEYEVGITAAPVEAIIWAAEKYAALVGVKTAKAELHMINARRMRFGFIPAYVSYGSVLF